MEGVPSAQSAEKTPGSTEPWWLRFLRSNPWVLVAIASPIVSGIVGWAGQRFIASGITTAAFVGGAAIVWMGALAYVVARLHGPIRTMLDPDSSRPSLSDRLDLLRNEFMTQIGTTVLEQAGHSMEDLESQLEVRTDDSTRPSVLALNLSTYHMDEETFREVEMLVKGIDVVRDVKETLDRAKRSLTHGTIFLGLWFPFALVAALFVQGLPQDPYWAFGVAFGIVYTGAVFWTWKVAPTGMIREWHNLVMEYRGHSDADLKREVLWRAVRGDEE